MSHGGWNLTEIDRKLGRLCMWQCQEENDSVHNETLTPSGHSSEVNSWGDTHPVIYFQQLKKMLCIYYFKRFLSVLLGVTLYKFCYTNCFPFVVTYAMQMNSIAVAFAFCVGERIIDGRERIFVLSCKAYYCVLVKFVFPIPRLFDFHIFYSFIKVQTISFFCSSPRGCWP